MDGDGDSSITCVSIIEMTLSTHSGLFMYSHAVIYINLPVVHTLVPCSVPAAHGPMHRCT